MIQTLGEQEPRVGDYWWIHVDIGGAGRKPAEWHLALIDAGVVLRFFAIEFDDTLDDGYLTCPAVKVDPPPDIA